MSQNLIVTFFSLTILWGSMVSCERVHHYDLVIENANVIDVKNGDIQTSVNIGINDGIIETITSGSMEGEDTIEADGSFVLPGFWDMHSHPSWSREDMKNYLRYGVMGLRIMNGDMYFLDLREMIQAGEVLGPRLVVAGRTLEGIIPDSLLLAKKISNKDLIEGTYEGRDAVRVRYADGYDFVKVYSSLSKETYYAIIEEANRLGLPVAGHVPFSIGIRNAAKAQRSLEHLGGLANVLVPSTAPIQPGSDLNSRIMSLQYAELERLPEILDDLKISGTFVVPTRIVEMLFASQSDLKSFTERPGAERFVWHLSNRKQISWLSNWSDADFENIGKVRKIRDQLTRMMVDSGIPVMTGTDLNLPGLSLHWELEELVRSGLTELEALQSATLIPAKYFNEASFNGLVKPDYRANLLLLRKNPLEDIKNTREIAGIVYDGKYHTKESLESIDTRKMLSELLYPEIMEKSLADGKELYQKIFMERPDSIYIDEIDLRSLANWIFIVDQKPEYAIEIMKWVKNTYPDSPMAAGTIGSFYQKKGNVDSARAYLKETIRLSDSETSKLVLFQRRLNYLDNPTVPDSSLSIQ